MTYERPVEYWQLSQYLRNYFGRNVDYDPFFHQNQGILIPLGILSRDSQGHLLRLGTGPQTIRAQIRITDDQKYEIDLCTHHQINLDNGQLNCSLLVSNKEQLVSEIWAWHRWLAAGDMYLRANLL